MEDISVQTSPPKKRKDKRTKALMNPEEYRLMLAKRRETERIRREKNPEYFKEKQKRANQRTKEKRKEMEIIMRLFMYVVEGLYKKDPDLITKLEAEYEASLGKKLCFDSMTK